jgi:NAD(P)-dependent dehydrogenase (short-subunit alcohol dehydrogenase family)
MQLTSKRALVTGGGTGVGFGCARRLLEQGAEV